MLNDIDVPRSCVKQLLRNQFLDCAKLVDAESWSELNNKLKIIEATLPSVEVE